MTTPAVEASKQQWRDYFAAGNRYDIPYNLDEMLTAGSAGAQIAYRALLTARSPDMAIGYGADALQIRDELAYVTNAFGRDPQHPTIGISGWGLHFPTLPGVPWGDVAAVIVSNQLSAMAQATNGHILETPPVGDASTFVRSDFVYNTGLCFITTDGRATRAQALPAYEGFVEYLETPAGRVLGKVMPPLDPFLGPEQIVEFLFLLLTMADVHGITVYQVGKYLEIGRRSEEIRLAN